MRQSYRSKMENQSKRVKYKKSGLGLNELPLLFFRKRLRGKSPIAKVIIYS